MKNHEKPLESSRIYASVAFPVLLLVGFIKYNLQRTMHQQEELFIFCQDCFNALAERLDQISEHIEALAPECRRGFSRLFTAFLMFFLCFFIVFLCFSMFCYVLL